MYKSHLADFCWAELYGFEVGGGHLGFQKFDFLIYFPTQTAMGNC